MSSDLEDEILALAGDEPEEQSPPEQSATLTGKRKRGGQSNSEGESSEHEGYTGESRRVSQRYADGELADDDDDAESYASDLMGDEEDRKRLLSMNEVQREQILSERAEKRQQKQDLTRVTSIFGKPNEKLENDSTRRSTRGNKKNPKYGELKRAREEKGQKRAQSAKQSSLDVSELEQRLSQLGTAEEKMPTKELRKSYSGEEIMLEELQSIQMIRRHLEKWVFAPFFDKTVVGCFVRLYIGTKDEKHIYRVCEIQSVEKYHRAYKIEGNTLTNKALRLRHANASKVWPMDAISNAPFQQSEYDRWINTMKHYNLNFPTKTDIEEITQRLLEARDRQLTEEEVAYIISQKKELRGAQTNLVAEKAQLQTKKLIAQSEGNFVEVEQIGKRLVEIDSILNEQARTSDPRLHSWAQLNEKNRRKNLEDSRAAEAKAKEARRRFRAEELGSESSLKHRSHSKKLASEPNLNKNLTPSSLTALASSKPMTAIEETIFNLGIPVTVQLDPEYENEKQDLLKNMKSKYEAFNSQLKNMYKI